jgi:hypothetical protein
VGVKLNGTHRLLVYADDVNLLENNIKKILTDASKEICTEENTKKTKYSIWCCLVTRLQEKKHDMKIANRSFENVTKFKYLESRLGNQSFIQEKIKKILNSGNVCCHSVQNIFYSCLLSKKVKSGYTNIIIFPVVLYGCETWSLT